MSGETVTVAELKAYTAAHCSKEHPAVTDLVQTVDEALPSDSRMVASPTVRHLLSSMIRRGGYTRILECGVFAGVTTMVMALAAPEDAKVVGLDVEEKFVNVGRPFWEKAGVQDKINIIIGQALESMDTLIANGESGTYDLIFIDADKLNYLNYYEKALILARKGGAVVLDNTIWKGRILKPPQEQATSTKAIAAVNEFLKTDERVHTTIIETGDGVTICDKL